MMSYVGCTFSVLDAVMTESPPPLAASGPGRRAAGGMDDDLFLNRAAQRRCCLHGAILSLPPDSFLTPPRRTPSGAPALPPSAGRSGRASGVPPLAGLCRASRCVRAPAGDRARG